MAWTDHFAGLEDFDWDFLEPPVGPDPIWTTGGGDEILLSEIDDQHLQNIERFLLGRGATDAEVRPRMFENWYDTIRTELERRLLSVLGDHPVAYQRQGEKGT